MLIKLMILSFLLWSLTTLGCKTTDVIRPELPPRPKREYIGELGSIKDYALVLAYYEFLVEEWEAWADSVENIINK